jgi:HAD superfamily hydrolase (TIGR01490 family)
MRAKCCAKPRAGCRLGGTLAADEDARMASPPVAVFDLDGTITRDDTLRLLLRRGMARGPARPWAAVGLPSAWRAAQRDVAARGAFKACMLNIAFGGRTRAWLAPLIDGFVRDLLAENVKPAARAAIDRHRAAGHLLLLASASPDLWVQPIGAALGFDAVLCTRLAWDGDRFAGRLDGPNLLHAEKAAAVSRWMAKNAADATPHAAYTDHHHDLPMLLLAEHPVAVDPTPALAAEARARGIPIEHWSNP